MKNLGLYQAQPQSKIAKFLCSAHSRVLPYKVLLLGIYNQQPRTSVVFAEDPHGDSQLSVLPVPGDSTLCSDLHGYQEHR